MKRRELLISLAALASGCGGGGGSSSGATSQALTTAPAQAPSRSELLQKGGIWQTYGNEYGMVVFGGEILAIGFIRWEGGAFIDEAHTMRVYRYHTGELLASHPWPFGMGCAVVKDGAIHVFGNSNWTNPGNRIVHSVLDPVTFAPSTPQDALISGPSGSPVRFYNTSITQDASGYRMVVEMTGVVSFARSTDLATWTWDGGLFNPGQYTGCPSIHYLGGVHYLSWLSHMGNRRYETRAAYSADDCRTFVYGKPILSPEGDEGNNCSDVDMLEVDGKVYGVYIDGDQSTYGRLRRWAYSGTLAQMFAAYS